MGVNADVSREIRVHRKTYRGVVSRNVPRLGIAAMLDGMVPTRRFAAAHTSLRDGFSPRSGTVPVSLLKETRYDSIATAPDKSTKAGPVRRFFSTSSSRKFASGPRAVGIVPPMRLSNRFNSANELSAAISSGSSPCRLLLTGGGWERRMGGVSKKRFFT